jgi:hypothetical protein
MSAACVFVGSVGNMSVLTHSRRCRRPCCTATMPRCAKASLTACLSTLWLSASGDTTSPLFLVIGGSGRMAVLLPAGPPARRARDQCLRRRQLCTRVSDCSPFPCNARARCALRSLTRPGRISACLAERTGVRRRGLSVYPHISSTFVEEIPEPILQVWEKIRRCPWLTRTAGRAGASNPYLRRR